MDDSLIGGDELADWESFWCDGHFFEVLVRHEVTENRNMVGRAEVMRVVSRPVCVVHTRSTLAGRCQVYRDGYDIVRWKHASVAIACLDRNLRVR